MRPITLSRREALGPMAALLAPGLPARTASAKLRLASFSADVTPPISAPLFNAVRARSIADPLEAHGVAFTGAGRPLVLVAVDWCEIRNESYERWRSVLAQAANTSKDRVLVSCVHQHDAPYSDYIAQRLLKENGVIEGLCNPDYDEQALGRVATALSKSLEHSRPITHVGTGQGKVEKVASNRRYVLPNGKVSFGRTSATRDTVVRDMSEGTIDPWLKTISFWDGDRPVAALSCYSTHPMTFYGQGDVSWDFPGLARARRAREMQGVAQIYFTGCSGDTVAGRYNNGDPGNRPILADRIYQGMLAAWNSTRRVALEGIGFRSVPLKLAPRRGSGFSCDDYRRILADNRRSRLARFEAALGLSWLERLDAGHAIDVPAIDFGPAQLVLMPAETFVQYQLWAQEIRPESFVMTLGFGECAPGYIPTARAVAEGYDDHYSWIAFPECEPVMREALRRALQRSTS
jgi:hypothetical protein